MSSDPVGVGPMSTAAGDQARAAMLGWQRTVDAAYNDLAASQAGANVDEARRAFFGDPPPGARRRILHTDATVPGGRDGIIVNRLYIADELAAIYQLYGDNRGPSTDPTASSRVSIAWDTRTGEVSITVNSSTVHEQSLFQEQSPFSQRREVAPWPINVGPDSLGTSWSNNFVVNTEPGRLDIRYDLINSGLPDPFRWGAVQGRASIAVTGAEIAGSAHGEDYPDQEVIQYRADGARMLHTRPMGDGGQFGGPIFGMDYDTPLGQWRARR